MKIAAALLSFLVLPFAEASEMAPPVLATAVQQLRQAAGRWNVTTTRYAENGAVAAVATGTLSFDWVVPDRVLAGKSVIPDWNQSAGMLFYLNERMFTLEMAQVGGDGQLIVMSGPAGTETRTAEPIALPDGRRMLQRHTRYGVTRRPLRGEDGDELRRRRELEAGLSPALRPRARAADGLRDPASAPHPAAALRPAHVARRRRRA